MKRCRLYTKISRYQIYLMIMYSGRRIHEPSCTYFDLHVSQTFLWQLCMQIFLSTLLGLPELTGRAQLIFSWLETCLAQNLELKQKGDQGLQKEMRGEWTPSMECLSCKLEGLKMDNIDVLDPLSLQFQAYIYCKEITGANNPHVLRSASKHDDFGSFILRIVIIIWARVWWASASTKIFDKPARLVLYFISVELSSSCIRLILYVDPLWLDRPHIILDVAPNSIFHVLGIVLV